MKEREELIQRKLSIRKCNERILSSVRKFIRKKCGEGIETATFECSCGTNQNHGPIKISIEWHIARLLEDLVDDHLLHMLHENHDGVVLLVLG